MDTLYIVDNTKLNAAIMAEMESGILLSKDPDAPMWVENILNYVENDGD
ncbi:hypothetical protein [Domibacillus mangrovi]|nr:hypothetical protein [Domibacillus mangrovi]